jgi:hypothetical protein
MNKFIKYVLVLLLIDYSSAYLNAQKPLYSGPSCIGRFCLNINDVNMLMTEKQFVQKYGAGYTKGTAHCYEVSQEKVYLLVKAYHGDDRRIIDYFVSKDASCIQSLPPKVPFKTLETSEHLKIGDPLKKVISLYGEPNVEEEADGTEKVGIDYQTQLKTKPFGDKRLRYLPSQDSLLRADIYLRDERVSAILISVSP